MAFAKQVGDRVGPYALTEVLGEGGAGQVFAARWEPDDEQRAEAPDGHPAEVAVKLLRASHAGSEQLFHRFIREIDVAQRIHHPHLVQHFDSGLADDVLYYAMELVPYGSLRDALRRRGSLPWRDAAEGAMHTADALGALHDAGVVHRDLKPDNIFLSESGVLKLGDFGLAYSPDQRQLTVGGQTVGSVRYMAPEQVRARRDLDGRCDLYALGCVLFEMLTGRPPFTSTDAMEVFYQHAEVPPPCVDDFAPSAPPQLVDLVDRLLRKNRDDRPPTAQCLRDALAAMLVSEDGRIASLDALLVGDPAAIEPAPPGDDDFDEDDGSLSGRGSFSDGGLTGADGSRAAHDDEDDDFDDPGDPVAEQRRVAAAAAKELSGAGTDLSKRLAEGEATPASAGGGGGAKLFGLLALAVIAAAIIGFVATTVGGDSTADAATSEPAAGAR